MALFSKHCNYDWTQGAWNPTKVAPPEVDRKILMQIAKIGTLNDSHICWDRREGKVRLAVKLGSENEVFPIHMRHDRHGGTQDTGTENGSSADHHLKNRCTREKDFRVAHPINDHFMKSLDNWTHHIPDMSSSYKDMVPGSVAKGTKRLQAKMKTQTLSSYPIPITSYLSALKLASNTNSVHEQVGCSTFLWKRRHSRLNDCIEFRSMLHKHQNEGTVALSSEAVNYLV